jgi:hypothetical protein
VPNHTLDTDTTLRIYELKGMAKQHIHLSSLNFKVMPEHIRELIELVKKR